MKLKAPTLDSPFWVIDLLINPGSFVSLSPKADIGFYLKKMTKNP
jgi:hypothetical protein